MADNDLTVVAADGTTKTLRSKDVGAGVQVQVVEVATMIPTPVVGSETIAVGTAVDAVLTVPVGATHALLTVDTGGGDVRYWEDGTSPSSAAGLLIPAGGVAELTNLANVKMRSTVGNVNVNVAYRKYA